jgi:hypothetical protein
MNFRKLKISNAGEAMWKTNCLFSFLLSVLFIGNKKFFNSFSSAEEVDVDLLDTYPI